MAVTLPSIWAAAVVADDVSDDGDDESSPVELGLLVGGGFYQINSPSDPPGSDTFLFGSSFGGGGFSVGPTVLYNINHLFGLTSDLLFSSTYIDGFAESGAARRDVTIREHTLSLALLARLYFPLPNPELELGLGPQLVIGLDGAIEEKVEGVSQVEEPLQVNVQTWVIPVAQLGAAIHIGRFRLPILIRAGWNPFYPDTTAERFESYQGPDDPGPMTIGFDWYITGLVGFRFAL